MGTRLLAAAAALALASSAHAADSACGTFAVDLELTCEFMSAEWGGVCITSDRVLIGISGEPNACHRPPVGVSKAVKCQAEESEPTEEVLLIEQAGPMMTLTMAGTAPLPLTRCGNT